MRNNAKHTQLAILEIIMPKDILKSFDTLTLGNGFFLHWGKLYFFSPQELKDILNECLENLKKLGFEKEVELT